MGDMMYDSDDEIIEKQANEIKRLRAHFDYCPYKDDVWFMPEDLHHLYRIGVSDDDD